MIDCVAMIDGKIDSKNSCWRDDPVMLYRATLRECRESITSKSFSGSISE